MELFSPGHLIVLAIIVAVLFFGWKQLPDMARSVGRSLRIFKTEIKGMTEDDKARDEARDTGAKPVIDAAPQDAPSVEKPAPTTGSGSASVKPNDAA
jgi:sec-independent protein translocase protein TatA